MSRCNSVIALSLLSCISYSYATAANLTVQPKKQNGDLTRAEIYAKALRYCKKRLGPEAIASDLKLSSKPWRVTCGIRDHGYKESFQ
jgi:hypothetical protein